MKKLLLIFSVAFLCKNGVSQTLKFPDENMELRGALSSSNKNIHINAESLLQLLATWNKYPSVSKGVQYIVTYTDSVMGDIPMRVYIPAGYNENIKTPLLLLLHGAVSSSSFNDLNNDSLNLDEDIFFNYFKNFNYIIVRPKADKKRKFDWVVSPFRGSINRTFEILEAFTMRLKEVLNIDDQRVTCLGHSDGADGTFAMDILKPDLFNAFVCYNSMFTVIFSKNLYLRNAKNKPLYIVHSDRDALRAIEQTRLYIKAFDSLSVPNTYKEYIGYEHYDKHLQMNLPTAFGFIEKQQRNPFTKNVYWETDSSSLYNKCNWVRICKIDTKLNEEQWHSPIKIPYYDKVTKTVSSRPNISSMNASGAINATYYNNQFSFSTSRIKSFEVLLSKKMIDIDKAVKVIVNGKVVFNKKVGIDSSYILTNFIENFDRQEVWYNSIKIDVNSE